LANTIAAAFASDHQIPVIFTSQPPPDEPLPPQTNLADAYAILRKLKKAEKSTSPAPHTSLGVSAYVQASSPLRRYGDLLAHYQIKAFLKNGPLPFGRDELVEIMGHQDAVSAEASRMERNRTRYWQLVYLSEHGDEIFDALVLAVLDNRNGGTVLLPSLAMRCNVAFQTRLAPGDVIRTQVISVNPRKDELHLKHVV
ncbi:RNB domain-containing ribonuclease, partial [Myxococcota bacterium]|nr:RNB domain-containing ribonuclease [Myxococcota bacterium]